MKTKFLFVINAMYLSNPFGITSIFTPMFTTPVSCTSKFSCYVTMISNFFIVDEFFIYPANVTWLKIFLVFFSDDQIFVEMFFHYFFIVFIGFIDCFNKFRSSIFTSVKNHWFTKSIINTNKFVSKTTRNVILIFFEQELS